MKRFLPIVFLIGIVSTRTLTAQIEIFNWQGYAIGADVAGPGNCAMGAMPDVILINSTYYMYYIARYNNAVNAIYYATSSDMISWAVQDTIMCGSADTTNRLYDLGGPGVMKLNNGQYRLFYRTAQKATFPNEPLFHIRSMISNDGIHFTHEAGVRVENSTYQANSYFKSASHPSVYKDANGMTRAIITGRDSSMSISAPAGLYTAVSNDEGLTWSGFQPLYAGCHDPIVIRDSTGVYHMYTSYMASGHREVTSSDGITWPAVPDSMLIRKNLVPLNEMTSAEVIADIGAAVDPSGNVYLYSNFKPQGPGAWVDVAYYTHDVSSGISENNSGTGINVFPNPAADAIIVTSDAAGADHYEITNASGQVVQAGILAADGRIDVSTFDSGLYFMRVFSEGDTGKKTLLIIGR